MPKPKRIRLDAARRLRTPSGVQFPERTDPAAVRAEVLRPLWIATALAGAALAAVAWGAPGWAGGDLRAALLPGVPAAGLLTLHLVGRRVALRRVAMALATATCGFLALATASSLGALDDPQPAVLFQVSCFAISAAHLGVAAPAWRRVEREGSAADEVQAMYDEL